MSTKTAHLKLRPFSGDDLLALIEGAAEGKRQIGLPLADGLREFFVSGEVRLSTRKTVQSGDGNA